MKGGYSTHRSRQSNGGSRFYGAPLTKWLMIALFTLFLADVVGADQWGRLKPWFAMNGARLYELWRWMLYPFIDFNVLSWIFSLMLLYSFGRVVEQSIGSRRYGVFLSYCVLGGALVYSLMSLSSVGGAPLTGASTISIGLVVAAAMLFPDQQVQMMLPPKPVKLKSLAMFLVGFVVVMSIAQRADPAVSLAQLSGVVVAYFCLKKRSLLDVFQGNGIVKMPRKSRARNNAQRNQNRKPNRPSKKKAGMKARTVLNMSVSKREAEVNRILDKVSAEGIGNLTDEEKEILKFAAQDK